MRVGLLLCLCLWLWTVIDGKVRAQGYGKSVDLWVGFLALVRSFCRIGLGYDFFFFYLFFIFCLGPAVR